MAILRSRKALALAAPSMFHDDHYWARMKEQDPEAFADACDSTLR